MVAAGLCWKNVPNSKYCCWCCCCCCCCLNISWVPSLRVSEAKYSYLSPLGAPGWSTRKYPYCSVPEIQVLLDELYPRRRGWGRRLMLCVCWGCIGVETCFEMSLYTWRTLQLYAYIYHMDGTVKKRKQNKKLPNVLGHPPLLAVAGFFLSFRWEGEQICSQH